MDEDTRSVREEEAYNIPAIDNENRDVFALIGPAGSGKSTAAEYIERYHDEAVTTFEMSDFVREKYKAEVVGDREPNDNALGEWAANKKSEHGDGYFAAELARTVNNPSAPHIVISGVRSPKEAKAIEDEFGHVTTVALWTLPELRFKRKYGAEPSEDHPKWDEFVERNGRELDLWGAVQFYAAASDHEADYIIPNNDSLDNLGRRVKTMLTYGHWKRNPFVENEPSAVRPYL